MASTEATITTTPAPPRASLFRPNMAARKLKGNIFVALGLFSILFGLGTLVALIADVVIRGAPWLDWDFLTSPDSRFPDRSGIRIALIGTAYMMAFTILFALPLGVMSAIFLEEYAGTANYAGSIREELANYRRGQSTRSQLVSGVLSRFASWLTRFIEVNIANLASVPSIIYGLLGLGIFAGFLALGTGIIAGALTMTLLVLPIIIVASREAIRAVPQSLRAASYAVGATRWQTIKNHVLPYAFPGILTGNILAASRAIGETAPLIVLGVPTFVLFEPQNPMDIFTVLPVVIFNWGSKPQPEFHDVAAAGIMVLMAVLLLMNSVAVFLRYRLRRKR